MDLPDFLNVDDGGFIHARGHRIGLHHILRPYNEGQSPEMIVANYPTLSLSLVHKVIAFYLDRSDEVDAYITEHDLIVAEQMAAAPSALTIAALRARLEAKRKVEVEPSAPL